MLKTIKETFKSIKLSPTGFEFDLNNEIIEAQQSLQEVKKELINELTPEEVIKSSLLDYYQELALNISNPRAAILLTGIEIENSLNQIGNASNIETLKLSTKDLISKLNSKKVISIKSSYLLIEFLEIRNKIVHNKDEDISTTTLRKTLELGQEVLKLLKGLELKITPANT